MLLSQLYSITKPHLMKGQPKTNTFSFTNLSALFAILQLSNRNTNKNCTIFIAGILFKTLVRLCPCIAKMRQWRRTSYFSRTNTYMMSRCYSNYNEASNKIPIAAGYMLQIANAQRMTKMAQSVQFES
jgi:hypothetical protein